MTENDTSAGGHGAAVADRLLGEADLARHWGVSRRTLQRLRAGDQGPAWIALGSSVRYRWRDILDFEDRMRRPRGRP